MTQRITVSLPDDIAARITVEPNSSAFIADLVRARIASETVREALAAAGMHVTDEGIERARRKLRQARERKEQRGPVDVLANLRAQLAERNGQ